MCTGVEEKFGPVFNRIAKYFKNVAKVCRVVALLDALLGLIILSIILIRRIKSIAEFSESTIVSLVLLSLQVFEIGFAIILYEGVRREVPCTVKIWFLYCIARFMILSSTIYPLLVSDRTSSKLRILIYFVEGTFTLFHIIQCAFLLALHRSRDSEPAATIHFPDGENHANPIVRLPCSAEVAGPKPEEGQSEISSEQLRA